MALNETIKSILLSVSHRVYLYTATGNTNPPYIIYGIDGGNNLFGENSREEFVDAGYIDLFTKEADDDLVKNIPAALDVAGISFYLNSVQFEEETGLLHYEWRWESA